MLAKKYFLFFLILLFWKSYAQKLSFTGENGEVEGSYKPGALQIFEIKASSNAKVYIKWHMIGLDGRMPACIENYIEVITGGYVSIYI